MDFIAKIFLQFKPIYKSSLIAFGVLLFILCFIAITHLGFTKDPAYWGEPGVPLLGWQAVVAILIGMTILTLGLRFAFDRDERSAIRTDVIFADSHLVGCGSHLAFRSNECHAK